MMNTQFIEGNNDSANAKSTIVSSAEVIQKSLKKTEGTAASERSTKIEPRFNKTSAKSR